MISPKYGIAAGDFLSLTKEEIERARKRVRLDAWKSQGEELLKKAEKIISSRKDLPISDSSWHDKNPSRDFKARETYNQYSAYNQPIMLLASDAVEILKVGVIFEREDILERAKAWAFHVITHHKFDIDHYDSGLVYAQFGVNLTEVFIALNDRFSVSERSQYIDQLTVCGETIMRCQKMWLTDPVLTRMAYNNHLAIQNAGLLALGIALERTDWVEQALDGPRCFSEMLAGATLDHGCCYESSTTYHYGTLGGLFRIANMVRCCPGLHRDLFTEKCADGRTLKQMFDAPLTLLFPNGELPTVGDAYTEKYYPLWTGWRSGKENRIVIDMYEQALAIYGSPEYIWFLHQDQDYRPSLLYGADQDQEKGAPVKGGSKLCIEHGYALLSVKSGSEYWHQDGFTCFMTGDRSGIHSHKDSLSMTVYGGKRVWTNDVNSRPTPAGDGSAFAALIQSSFNRTMLAHNTVVIDEQNQNGLKKTLPVIRFRDIGECAEVSMTDDSGQIYDGVKMRRHAAVTEEYCLDVFEIEATEERVCDWVLHPRTDGAVETGLTFEPAKRPDHEPYSVLKTVEKAKVGKATRMTWKQEDDRLGMDLSVNADACLFRCTYPSVEDHSGEDREMFMLRARGSSLAFIALYQLDTDAPYVVTSTEKIERGEVLEMRVTLDKEGEKSMHIFRGLTACD